MTIKECYDSFGGDYEEALARLMNRESMVVKYAKKFLNDTSFQQLEEAIAAGNMELIFRMAHTLKGVCGNLSFKKLGAVSVTLTDMVRPDAGGNLPAGTTMDGVKAAFEAVKTEYHMVIGALGQLD